MAKPLLVEIFGDASQYTRTLDKAAGRTQRFGAATKVAGLAVATGLVVGLEKSVKAAISAQESQARLEQAFKNAKIAIDPLKDRIDELEASGRQLGFTDEQVKQSLGSLIVSTGNYEQAARQLAIAQDLARFKSVDLESATKALTMAHAGSLRPLKQLGIDIPKVTTAQDALKASTDKHTGAAYQNALAIAKAQDKQATFANVLETVTGKVGGQAQAFSKTAAGGMAQFNAQVEHLKVEIGTGLLPKLTALLKSVNQLIGDMDALSGRFKFQIAQLKTITPLFANIGYFVKILVADMNDLGSAFAKTNEYKALIGILHGMAAAFQGVESAIRAVINAVKALVGALKSIPTHINLPHIPDPRNIHWPGRAAGGSVSQGRGYIVGERGPEFFVPGSSGRIVANSRLGMAGGGGMTVNLQLDGRTLASLLVDPLRGQVMQLRRQGGRF